MCCRGSGGAVNNREPLAVAAAAVVVAAAGVVEGLESVARRANDAVADPEDWGAEEMGSGLEQGSVRVPTGGESRDDVGVDAVDGLHPALDGGREDDLAVASPAPSGDDAKRRGLSARLHVQINRARKKSKG